jgi:hypothetical protein
VRVPTCKARTSMIVGLLTCAVAAAGVPSVHAADAPPRDRPGGKAGYGFADPTLGRALHQLEHDRRAPGAGRLREGRIRVEVLGTAGTNVVASVRRAGGRVVAKVGPSFVLADVPPGNVAALEARSSVQLVRLPVTMSEPQDETPVAAGTVTSTPWDRSMRVGTYGSDAVQRTGISSWHQAGYVGAGVKVGIIDSFNGDVWNQVQGAGEIRAPAGVFCRHKGSDCDASFWQANTPHGTAVAEVITDMAPGVTLYLASATTTTDIAEAVAWFRSHGVRIISRSETAHYDGAGDGTGPLATVMGQAVTGGMAWFNSAGNSAKSYFRSPWVDTDGDKWLEFPDGSEAMLFDCAYINGLRWNDWGSNRTDYDIYVYDTYAGFTADRNSNYISLGSTYQTTNNPIELVVNRNNPDSAACNGGADGTTLNGYDVMAVYKYADGNGTNGDVLEFMTNGAGVEFPSANGAYSAGGPAADTRTPGTAAIGSVHIGSTTIAPYSSRGPSNDGRIRPDLAAASNMTSLAYTVTDKGGKFSGTSAATPVVAGAAAVVLGREAGLTPQQLVDRMKTYVVDRGAAGTDNEFGLGELSMPAPSAAGPPAPGGPTTAPAITGVRFRPVAKRLTKKLPVKLSWATATPQATAYIARSVNRGPARVISSVPGGHTHAQVRLQLGKVNQLAVSYADKGGTVSPFHAASPVTPTVYDDANRKVKFGRGWHHILDRKAWNNTLTATNDGASRARLSFRGLAVSLVLTKSANSGPVRVYVDGRVAGRVNLHSRHVEHRRIAMNLFASRKGRHVVEVQPLSRGARGWVYVDGFVVLR